MLSLSHYAMFFFSLKFEHLWTQCMDKTFSLTLHNFFSCFGALLCCLILIWQCNYIYLHLHIHIHMYMYMYIFGKCFSLGSVLMIIHNWLTRYYSLYMHQQKSKHVLIFSEFTTSKIIVRSTLNWRELKTKSYQYYINTNTCWCACELKPSYLNASLASGFFM